MKNKFEHCKKMYHGNMGVIEYNQNRYSVDLPHADLIAGQLLQAYDCISKIKYDNSNLDDLKAIRGIYHEFEDDNKKLEKALLNKYSNYVDWKVEEFKNRDHSVRAKNKQTLEYIKTDLERIDNSIDEIRSMKKWYLNPYILMFVTFVIGYIVGFN